jgi:hypothetical protein
MATPQLSPGILTREVDLTVGRAENVLDNIGAIAGPFLIGPVEDPVTISSEKELLDVFGKPSTTGDQFEYWMSASSYLSYGGILKVVRADSDSLKNSNASFEEEYSELKIKNFDDYNFNYSDLSQSFYFSTKNPGSWGNNLKVCIIDNAADQIINFNLVELGELQITVGMSVTTSLTNVNIPRNGTVENFNGYLKGLVTGVNNTNNSISVKIISLVSSSDNSEVPVNYSQSTRFSSFISNDDLTFRTESGDILGVGEGTLGSVLSFNVTEGTEIEGQENINYENILASGGSGTGASFTILRNSEGAIDSVILSSAGSGYSSGDVLTIIGSLIGGIDSEDDILINITQIVGPVSLNISSVLDWYNQQTLNLSNTQVFWKSIAEKPTTTDYSLQRGGSNDALHVVVVDDSGAISGIKGNILEKHLNLSKATDAVSAVNFPTKIWYKDYLASFSNYIFAGRTPSEFEDSYHQTKPLSTSFSSGFIPNTISDGIWGAPAQGKSFNVIGNKTYSLEGGSDYEDNTINLSSLMTSYEKFANKDEIGIDFLIYGPSLPSELESQAKANKLISIASERKDCIAVISPFKSGILNITNTTTQTNNIIKFFSSLPSSSYAVFDSGYKYTYDRFNNRFVYIPCNADVAGLMARTTLNSFAWYSPAGQQRGVLNNAVKLAYSPNKEQRDLLYSSRVNSIINQPGSGIILYGDKTALSYASAFDRINVRRLFLVVQRALERAANGQLFEFNDQVTRSNFVNIVEPYLRDIQAKRGVFDFRVICDESNNTPDVIDNNEFRADIFLKPTRSINYVTLTFVATRTGVSFEEVAGNV